MSSPGYMTTARLVFALLCLAGIIAVATGAVLEIRRMRRGDSIVLAPQFRMRLMSALIWAITLAALSYAVLFLWPGPGDREQAKRFMSMVAGAVVLFVVGLILLAYDFWLVGQARRLQQARFERNIDAMARAEIERMQQDRGKESGPPPNSPPNSPPDGAGS